MDLDFNIDLSDITDINIDLDVMQDDLIALLKDLYQDTIQASKINTCLFNCYDIQSQEQHERDTRERED